MAATAFACLLRRPLAAASQAIARLAKAVTVVIVTMVWIMLLSPAHRRPRPASFPRVAEELSQTTSHRLDLDQRKMPIGRVPAGSGRRYKRLHFCTLSHTALIPV
jgi:hypothetical protein